MKSFVKLFSSGRGNIIGMIHVPALPATPLSRLSMAEIIDKVDHEAEIYRDCGVDGVMIENMHDTPYCLEKDLEPHIGACMSVVGRTVRLRTKELVPVGVQVLAAANSTAIGVALAAQLQFVRAEGFVFGHVADEGWIGGCAGPLLRYRQQLGGGGISIICDIKKKHSAHAMTSDVSIQETAKAAKFFNADGVIVTGTATGEPANPQEISDVMKAVPDMPVLVGSGVTTENMEKFANAHALIIGSYFKKEGQWENDLDPYRIKAAVDEAARFKI